MAFSLIFQMYFNTLKSIKKFIDRNTVKYINRLKSCTKGGRYERVGLHALADKLGNVFDRTSPKIGWCLF